MKGLEAGKQGRGINAQELTKLDHLTLCVQGYSNKREQTEGNQQQRK